VKGDKKKEKKRLKKVCFERNFVVIFAAALKENKIWKGGTKKEMRSSLRY
jgi:uncharacterized protein YaeQ